MSLRRALKDMAPEEAERIRHERLLAARRRYRERHLEAERARARERYYRKMEALKRDPDLLAEFRSADAERKRLQRSSSRSSPSSN